MVAKPTFEDLKSQCGGIVGKAFIRGQGNFDHNSQWWTGDYWYLLEQAKPFKFEPCKGQLGFFTPVIFQPLPTAQSL